MASSSGVYRHEVMKLPEIENRQERLRVNSSQEMLKLIGRTKSLFQQDLREHWDGIREQVSPSRFLVVGGAGSIGGAVVKELFRLNPQVLHVLDISENRLAELVRDLRASEGYTDGEFHAYCFDALGPEFDAFANSVETQGTGYDYVLNFSALKHVRSEKDPFTLMRLVDVNIFATKKLNEFANRIGARKFFCVSTDKAANPVNMMGASKRIMEMFLIGNQQATPVSTARFANVAFSDGSLPYAWTQRMLKNQPLAAPNDVRRYFVTEQEAAQLCLFSIIQGADREIYFPKLTPELHLITFASMARKYLESLGYEPVECDSEDEARGKAEELIAQKKWPCFFFQSDTTGEKDFEEFYTDKEQVVWDRYQDLGVVKNEAFANPEQLVDFENSINEMKKRCHWSKEEILDEFNKLLPGFAHLEKGKNLDNRM